MIPFFKSSVRWRFGNCFSNLVTDNFYGMGKEVENLIMENNELLATKYRTLLVFFFSILQLIFIFF